MKNQSFLSVIGKVFAALFALILFLGIITGCIIGSEKEISGDYDYLLVLGTTVEGTEPSQMLRDRIEEASRQLSSNPDLICIVSGGKGDAENLSEAQCMYNELTNLGISPDRIWMEDQATTTVENFSYSLALIEEKTGSRPAVIGVLSSDFHLHRALMFAEEAQVRAIPVYAPSTHDFRFYSYFLREIIMVWYYSLIG